MTGSVSFSDFSRFAGDSFGSVLNTVIAQTSKSKMAEWLSSNSNQALEVISSIGGEMIGAWSQHPRIVLGAAGAGFLALQNFSQSSWKPSEVAKNLAISTLAATCLVALVQNSCDPVGLIPGAAALPFVVGFEDCFNVLNGTSHKQESVKAKAEADAIYHTTDEYYWLQLDSNARSDMKDAASKIEADIPRQYSYTELIEKAETGDSVDIFHLYLASRNYLREGADEATKARVGKIFLSDLKRLYTSDKEGALILLFTCFLNGVGVKPDSTLALHCLNRSSERHLRHFADYLISKHPITDNPEIEDVIDSYLGITNLGITKN